MALLREKVSALEELFRGALAREKLFLYLPASAWAAVERGEYNQMTFALDVRSPQRQEVWRGYPRLHELMDIQAGHLPLFRPHLTDAASWAQLVKRFKLQRSGLVGMPDGAVIRFLSTPVYVGLHRGGATTYQREDDGRLITAALIYPAERVRPLRRKLQDRLSQLEPQRWHKVVLAARHFGLKP